MHTTSMRFMALFFLLSIYFFISARQEKNYSLFPKKRQRERMPAATVKQEAAKQ